MKILVTGGAGYIGSVVVQQLLKRGYDVEVMDLCWFGNHLPKGVRLINRDTLTVTEKDLEQYDQVICLSGLSNDPMANFSPYRNFVENAAAPGYLAYVAKRAGVKRFIYASSCSIYGCVPGRFSCESSIVKAQYPYGISKFQGETGVMCMQGKNFSTIALRQGTVCGFSPRMRLDLVVNMMFKSAVRDKRIFVSNSKVWRPILSIQDAASAYICAVECNKRNSGIFNVTSGNYSLGEIAKVIKGCVKEYMGLDCLIESSCLSDLRNYKVSIKEARKVLGFEPAFTLKDIVQDLIDNLHFFQDFDNINYYNIAVFKKIIKRVKSKGL